MGRIPHSRSGQSRLYPHDRKMEIKTGHEQISKMRTGFEEF